METNQVTLSDVVREQVGVDVNKCYQCGKCTAGCAMAEEMDYPPSYLMRLLQTRQEENDKKVLSSKAIWYCLNCENCIGRCPKEVDIPVVMDYLREEALKRRCVHREAKQILSFHRAFLDSIRLFGRSYELGLVADFKLRTFRLMQDVRKVPALLKKGKLRLQPERIKNIQAIRRMFVNTKK